MTSIGPSPPLSVVTPGGARDQAPAGPSASPGQAPPGRDHPLASRSASPGTNARGATLPPRAGAASLPSLPSNVHHLIAGHAGVTANLNVAAATQTKHPEVAADYRRAAKMKGFIEGVHQPNASNPMDLLSERVQLDQQIDAPAPHSASDADVARLTHLKLAVLSTGRSEEERALSTHLAVPTRCPGPETSRALNQILDAIQDMKDPEAQAQALVRYLFTVPLDGFPSGSPAPAAPQSKLGRLASMFKRALLGSRSSNGAAVAGAPAPGWVPPNRGSATELVQQMSTRVPHFGRALDMAAAVKPYPGDDAVTPAILADVISARLPHHPAMPFERFDYLAACNEVMRSRAASAPGGS